jgi:amino acid adenylation domain-containing protein
MTESTIAPGAETLSDKKRQLLELMLAERKAQKQQQRGAAGEFPRADRSQPLPLSYAQQRLWFLNRLDPASPAYNIPAAVYLVGPLDPAALARAYALAVERHEDLRTNFRTSALGEPYAVTVPERRLGLPMIDLSAFPLEAAEEMAQQLVPAVSLVPFDLGSDHLLRLVLVRLAPEAHVLLLVIHHIIADVWSIGVFFRDVGAFYDSLAVGGAPAIEPLVLQYADYVVWLRQRMEETGELDRQLKYWVGQLGGAPAVVDLPFDFPRPPLQTFRGLRYALHIGGNVHRRLQAVAQPEEASLYMAALTVFYILLYRYTGQREILVGTPMANRDRVELESLVGFFVNTAVLRAGLDGNPTFRQLLRQVRETTLQAFAHHDLPFDRVVNALKLERDLSRNPLYQVDFAFQNLPAVHLRTPGLELKPFTLRETTSRFDLELDVKEAEDGLDGFIRYNVALFAPETIARMARHYEALLAGVLADPDRPISTLSFLSQAEIDQLLGAWNETAVPVPATTALALIEEQAMRTPEAPAVAEAGGITWSYAELLRRATLLARHLAAHGTAPEELVALALPRSPDLVAAILAVWKAGAAYVPLDPSYPEARLRYQLESAGVRRSLATRALLERLPFLGTDGREALCLDELAQAPMSGAVPEAVSDPDSAAYVLYTSGSTGRPKGVIVHHRGLVNYLDWCRRAYGLEAGKGSVVHSPLGFDLTVTSLLAPLAAGRPVHLAAEGEGIEPLTAALRGGGDFSLIKITPAHLEALGELLTPPEMARAARTLVIGGEALNWEMLSAWRENAPASRLVNEYGPTETVVGCAVEEAGAGATSTETAGPVPIGRPIQNLRLHVVDPEGELTAVGVPGELWIAGTGVARGYHGRPDLTAERFAPDPYAAEPGGRVYRTGDRVRRLPDGRLVFLGRLDHQVKVRGFRIELGEIEAVLAGHPDVQAAAVLARQDAPPGATTLVAYVAAPKARNLEADDLRAWLAGQLPDYMVPSLYVFLPSLPLTPNGKVDRRALPAPEGARLSRDADYVAPRTPIEMQVARIWSEVLKVDRVSVNDRFFDLGGQSMLAVQVISRVRDRLQVDVPVQSLFNDTTVGTLSTTIESERARGASADLPPITPVPRDQPLPLSFSQERLWFIEQLMPGLTAYNVSGAVRMEGALDLPALAAALNEIVRRHEVMRTTFTVLRGQPVQVIHPELRVEVPVVDLRHLAEDERRPAALDLARAAAGTPFDLERGPLLRPQLIRLAANEHLFLLVLHQLVYDMWSRDIFFGELVTLYQAFHRGLPAALPAPQLQYADYASWQRTYLTRETLAPQLDYWMRQLGGLQPLELPTDRPRPPVQSLKGLRRKRILAPELTKALKDVSRRQKVTLFVTLLSGFNALLHRSTGHPDVAVGSPVANRNRVETEGLLGFFANTVVLRVPDVHLDLPIPALLEQVKTMSLGAFAHQDIAFETLVNALQPQRDLARQPLFQVMFNFLINYQPPTMALPDLTLTSEEVQSGGVPFDFMVAMYEFQGRLHAICDYATDLFDASTVDRFLERFEILLASLAKNPRQTVGELEVLTSEERRQILVEWNDTRVEGWPETPVHRWLEHWADQRPGEIAAVDPEGSLTYAELDRRAGRLARRLAERGVGPDVVVALYAERGLDFLSAMLAVFKAGGAYLPLSPLHPEERTAGLLEQSGAPLVLAGRGLAERLSAAPCPVLDLEEGFAGEGDPNRLGRLAMDPDPDNLAYVLFTSGSTGVPKAVQVTHRGMLNHLWVKVTDLGLAAGDRLAQNAAQTFDISVWQFLAPLVVGGRVVIYPDAVAQSPQDLFDAVARDGITGLECVPSLLSALFDVQEETARDLSLRWLMLTGETLPPALVGRWLGRHPGIPLINAYGPAECSDDITHAHLREPLDPALVERTPIGRPVANFRLYVTDRALRPVPLGVPGELVAAGAGVGRGYLADPKRTAESFVPDPFAVLPGERAYRTGDLVRLRAEGHLEFLGRVDQQVKIRGFRIEPGEVEAVTLRHPQVRDCAVVAREDTPGNRRLVAYVVPMAGEEIDAADLRRAARGALPEYMVPALYVVLPDLPLTPNGKVDRRALPAPEGELVSRDTSYVAPRTSTETQVARIWGEVLQLDPVGVNDLFFDLGGQSLLAVQVVSRVRDALNVELPVQSLFNETSVATMAAEIDDALARGVLADAPPLEPAPRDGDLPLSFAQERLWFIDQLMPGLSAYNIPGAVRLRGDLDRGALERALNAIVERHEVLRTTFATRRGKPVQVVVPAMPLEIDAVDLRDVPAEERQARAFELAREAVSRPFDLATGPLLRPVLFELDREDVLFILVIHHIVYDMWSRDVFLAELGAFYEAFSEGREPDLPPLAIQYADFAVWQRRWLSGAVLDRQLGYWREQLAGLQPLELPTDRPRPAVQSMRGGRIDQPLPAELTAALKRFSQRQKVTLFVSLLSGFYALLRRYTGARDLAVGSPIANRNRVEIEPLLGFFANTLVLRAELPPGTSGEDLMARVRKMTLDAYSHQDLAFEKLVNEIQPDRDLGRQPLFQVMFNFLITYKPPARQLPRLTLETEVIHTGGVPFDFTQSMFEADGRLWSTLDYSSDLFDRTTVLRMLSHFERLLTAMVEEPGTPLEDLPLLGAAEQLQIVREWNDPATESFLAPPLSRWVEAQVERTPDAPAVVGVAGGVSTYRELNARANRLAHALRRRGVGADRVVAIAVERSFEMAVAVLGVLKAGGAYLPLDTSLPAERLAFMLADADCALLLTQEHLLPDLPAGDVATLLLADDFAEEPESNPIVSVDGDHLGYLIYTSGSTGRPKGIAMTQVALSNLVAWQVSLLPPGGLRTLQLASLSFDASFTEMFSAWSTGGCIVLTTADERQDLAALGRLLAERQIERAILPVVALQQLAQLLETPPAGLREIVSTGEQLQITGDVRRFFAAPGAPRLRNDYGPSETHVVTTCVLEGPPEEWAAQPSIGRPIPGTRVHVLDTELRPVPAGVIGEVWLGGVCLARGYLKRADLTAAAFRPDPFAAEAGGRLYRTGDLGRHRADGTLEFLGRIDHQVKIRGFRVEPSEVQAALDRHPAVAACAVVARRDAGDSGDRGAQRLVAYVVAPGDQPEITALRAFLLQTLPEYMVPAAWVYLDALPLNANGKLDRAALPAPGGERVGQRVYVAPRTASEETLAGIWSEVLGLERVGVEDSFFDLGGHSLLGVQVISRISEAFGIELPLRQIFAEPTVAALAQTVERLRWALSGSADRPLAAGEEEGEL